MRTRKNFSSILIAKHFDKWFTAAVLSSVLIFGTTVDQLAILFMDKTMPQYAAVIPVTEWMGNYHDECHPDRIFAAVALTVIGNSFRKRIAQSMTD